MFYYGDSNYVCIFPYGWRLIFRKKIPVQLLCLFLVVLVVLVVVVQILFAGEIAVK